jgi:hypothetical protein
VIRSDRLAIFERVNPFAELSGPNRNDNDGTQSGDCEYRDGDYHKSEEHLHKALTFRRGPTVGTVATSDLLSNRLDDHSLT